MRIVVFAIVLYALNVQPIWRAYAFDLQRVAADVSSGIGQAKVHTGSKGPTIVVFEERHDSYTMYLEESVGLIRLFKNYGLRDIGLEGFTDTDKPWTKDFSPNPDAALALLNKGEINSAAFMALAYGLNVHPIERASEYIVVSNDGVNSQVSEYLLKIALDSFKKKLHAHTLSPDIVAQVSKLQADHDTPGLQRLITQLDDFTKRQIDRVEANGSLGFQDTSEEIEFFEGIENQARALNVDISSASSAALARYIQFLKAREAASDTMARRIAELGGDDSKVVAMIIGANHTSKIVSLLTAQKRSVIVVSPFAVPPGGREVLFTDSQFAALYKGEPLEHDPVTAALRLLDRVKPKMDFNARWLQTKSEIYAKVDDLVKNSLGNRPVPMASPQGRGRGGEPPMMPPIDLTGVSPGSPEFRNFVLAIPPDRTRGKGINIDKSRMELVHTANGTSLVFPVQIIGSNGQVEKEFWVRAWASKDFRRRDDEDVERRLLDRIKSGEGPRSEKVEAEEVEADVVDISKVTTIAMAPTKEAVLKVDIPASK
jgi:hypothetical protein